MQVFNLKPLFIGAALAGVIAPCLNAEAAPVTVTFANVSGANGPALSPFFVAFHDGTFDPFNAGAAASASIKAIAELGNGAGLSSDFAASHPDGYSTTVTASVNGFGPGIFLPAGVGSVTVDLDPVKQRYLSYFSMVVPSNDRFLGNDSPTEIQLFDSNGNFQPTLVVDNGSAIWDAGTELDGLTGAAFIVGSNALDNPPQNGLVTASSDFLAYFGAATPAGYSFTDLPDSNSPLLRVSVSAVPVPAAFWLFGSGLSALGLVRRRVPVQTG